MQVGTSIVSITARDVRSVPPVVSMCEVDVIGTSHSS